MTRRLKSAGAGLAVLLALLRPVASQADEGWVTLFDGKTTAGWVQRGGKAAYAVEDGALVGRTVLGERNSFLCPPKEYADFVLEFEVWVDPKVNSGVQFRSASRPDYRDGVVHGYQVEIDPSERAWSGGLYDEQRRGWLASPKDDPVARKAFRVGEWNRYRVEAKGDRLRTWVNDVPVSDLVDGMARSGFIGFQVHQAKEAGLVVKWRAIRLKELAPVETGLAPNTLSAADRGAGWRLLWDGLTTWGWRDLKAKDFPKEHWSIGNGVLSAVKPSAGAPPGNGDIVTDRRYGDFELTAEFRLSPGANSGIKYFVRTDVMADGGQSSVGLEYQVIDDVGNPDVAQGKDGVRTTAALYDVYGPAPDKPVKPMGEWNQARIVARGRHVEHWLNGAKVLEFERGSADFKAHVAEGKHRVWPSYGEWADGLILLQHHGGGVSYRNVRIRELK